VRSCLVTNLPLLSFTLFSSIMKRVAAPSLYQLLKKDKDGQGGSRHRVVESVVDSEDGNLSASEARSVSRVGLGSGALLIDALSVQVALAIVSPTKRKMSSSKYITRASKGTAANSSRFVATAKSHRVAQLLCYTINWLNQAAMFMEVHKLVKFKVDVPASQENRLEQLMNKFSLQDLKHAYLITMGKVGHKDEAMSDIMLQYNFKKEVAIEYFFGLIYDHRCMMYDNSPDAFR
jgi:hypothetical protein